MKAPGCFLYTSCAVLYAVLCAATLLLVVGCAASKQTVVLPAFVPSEQVTSTHIPYPILLLHGLGQKSSVWDAQAVKFYEQEGLSFGGTLKKVAGKCVLDAKNPSGFADFFTVSFSNPVDSVGAWKRELDEYVRLVRERTRADKVMLIGYSMGGLTGRYYLTQHLADHHVQRLITIGSPHQGSPFAKIWQWKTSLVNAQKTANPVVAAILKPAVDAVNSAEKDVPFDAPAVRDLMRPEDGGEFTKRTGSLPHPNDVEYVSVVGRVEVLKEIQAFSKSGVQELVRRALEAIGFGMDAAFSDGDGVVSARSQTINELPWFQADRSRQRISQTITLSTVHEDHLRKSTEIQRVSLDAKPEFKGADFVRFAGSAQTLQGAQPAFVLEFVDYLPPRLCTVELSISNISGRSQGVLIPQDRIALVRKQNGTLVAQAVCVLPPNLDFTEPLEATFTVKNSFGNQFSASKSWMPR
jgi:pimeloyl-ACP methyl ester carboxylesterase